jgi:hypothetical protein
MRVRQLLLAVGLLLTLCFPAEAQFNGCSSGACPSTFGAGIGPGGGSGGGSTPPPSWVNGAQIALNFATNQYYVAGTGLVSLSSLVTLTRAGSETATDSLGNITTVGNNTPAITDVGLQSTWESRTNLALQSGSMSTSPWASFVNGSGTVAVVANAGTAPDGTNSLTKVTVNRTSGSDFAQFFQTFTGTAATYTGSVWIGAATAGDVGKRIQLTFSNGTTQVGSIIISLPSTLTRYVISNVTLLASASCQFVSGYYAGGIPDGNVAPSYFIWGAQIERASTVGPYIPTTTTTVTRPADNVVATGALATLLANPTGSIAAWTNADDQLGIAKTLVAANGTVLLGTNSSNQATSALGATLNSSNTANWTGVNNLGFSWDGTGGLLNLIGTQTTDATARTPSAPFQFFSTGGTSNFYNGSVGIMLFYNTKQSLPTVALPSGVTPGFITRYSWSTLPSTVQYRNFVGRTNVNGGSPIFLQNSGTYNATGTNTPYVSNSSKIGSSYLAGTEGAVSGPTNRTAQWININTYTGTDPLTWTPDASNPAITAGTGGALDAQYLLHPAITRDFAGGAAYTMYYSALDSGAVTSRIFWATSPTGVAGTWTKQGVAINSGNASYPNPALPSLVTIGSTIYMYAVTNGNNGNQIVVFTSPVSGNGSTWTYAGVALAAPVAGDWDFGTLFILDPFVFRNKHGWYEMGYTVNLSGIQKLGYAVSDNPLGPFIKYPALLQNALHFTSTGGTGDIAFIEDVNNFYFLWDEDNAQLSGISNPYAATLPPY